MNATCKILVKLIFGLALFLSLSFTIENDVLHELDGSKVVISEWFPHEFNLNPANATSFKISDDRIESMEDIKIWAYGRNMLGVYALPYKTSSQHYSYQVTRHHIEFKAERGFENSEIPFDFFEEFRYVIVPKNEIDAETIALDWSNYKEVAEHFELND